jgi:Aspartyl protease
MMGAGLMSCVRVAGLALGCVAANLAWVCGSASAAQCVLKSTGSADIRIRNDRVLVPVTINGHGAEMELNTAAASTWISSAYLKPFGLKQDHNLGVTWSGAHLPSAIATFTDVRVGSQSFRRAALVAFRDRRPASEDATPDVGQLGMNFLGIEDFEIDFANNRLNFYSTDHCPGVVVYWTDHYSSAHISRDINPAPFHLPMELGGRKILAVISTATPVTTVGTDVTRKLFGFDETSPGIEAETDGAEHTVTHYRSMVLTGSGITITNAKIRLAPRPLGLRGDSRAGCALMTHGSGGVAYYDRCHEEAPLSLGLDVLRRLHLYFAVRERVLYFSDAAATK